MGLSKGVAALVIFMVGIWLTGIGVPDEYEITTLVVKSLYDGLGCQKPELQSNPGCQQAAFWSVMLPVFGWIALFADAVFVYSQFRQ